MKIETSASKDNINGSSHHLYLVVPKSRKRIGNARHGDVSFLIDQIYLFKAVLQLQKYNSFEVNCT